MKVSNCKNCKYCKRYAWSSSYKPAGYHRVGVSHVYRFCEKHNKRCLEVKKCKEI